MGKPISKPSPDNAMSGHNGTFLLNSPATYVFPAGEWANAFVIDIDLAEITELYINGDNATNVVAKYIQNPAIPLLKDEMIVSRRLEQFTKITWTVGKLTAVNGTF